MGEVMRLVVEVGRQNRAAYPGRPEIDGDYIEIQQAMHVVQHHIMRSALARSNPTIIRPLGVGLPTAAEVPLGADEVCKCSGQCRRHGVNMKACEDLPLIDDCGGR